MRRILTKAEFFRWLDDFFPELADGKCGNLLSPVSVSDVNDGHLVHLAGLNLNRAWTMGGILSVLEPDDPSAKTLAAAIESNQRATWNSTTVTVTQRKMPTLALPASSSCVSSIFALFQNRGIAYNTCNLNGTTGAKVPKTKRPTPTRQPWMSA